MSVSFFRDRGTIASFTPANSESDGHAAGWGGQGRRREADQRSVCLVGVRGAVGRPMTLGLVETAALLLAVLVLVRRLGNPGNPVCLS